ncbi:MAG TPA: prolipoprotein diacylglyceryl transferase [Roseimicrobium sp.]|nr:prolipoprotein diacylglyceryl transferase [Roseimicrobium sp.]
MSFLSGVRTLLQLVLMTGHSRAPAERGLGAPPTRRQIQDPSLSHPHPPILSHCRIHVATVSSPNVNPIALHFGSLTLYWYGVLAALGFMAGFWTASRRALRVGVSPDRVMDLGPWIIVGAIVGARILYVISYWKEQFAQNPFPEIFMIQHGGLVYYGGLIGASLGTILFAKLKKIPLWQLSDIMAPSIALGHAFGRIGCLMNGCCYGHASSLPWAIHYPTGHATHPAGVHPTQVYESVLNFALYATLAWWFRRRRKFDGQVFAIYLLAYAILRTVVESFRGDYPVHYLGGVATPAQLVSAGIFATGLILYFRLPRKLTTGPAAS